MFIFCIFAVYILTMNEFLESLSTSQYAYRSGIVIQDYYPLDEDQYQEVYYDFKEKNKQLVAKKYESGIHSLNCFPFTFYSKPNQSTVNYVLKTTCLKLGFLNKNKPTGVLSTYIDLIIKNKYYIYSFDLNVDNFIKHIDEGKSMELEEMDLDLRKYIWEDQYRTLSKNIKIKIMNKDRFAETKKETMDKMIDAVNYFIYETNDFIHNKIIADYSGLPLHTIKNYSGVFRKEIDQHNKNNYGCTSYHDYTLKINLDTVESCIINLIFKKKKINIANITRESKNIKDSELHRNTITKYFKTPTIKAKIDDMIKKYT